MAYTIQPINEELDTINYGLRDGEIRTAGARLKQAWNRKAEIKATDF